MISPFQEYAKYYDLLYKDKDYKGEAEFIDQLLKRVLSKPAAQMKILDLACGTGRHAQELSKMDYGVEGSDISSDMVAMARRSAEALNLPIHYHNESFQNCNRIDKRYDAVIAMFSAIDYLTNND